MSHKKKLLAAALAVLALASAPAASYALTSGTGGVHLACGVSGGGCSG
jgi:hypothetical protein